MIKLSGRKYIFSHLQKPVARCGPRKMIDLSDRHETSNMDGIILMKIFNLPLVHYIHFSEIEEKRPLTVVTSGPAWDAVKERLPFKAISVIDVHLATTEHWDNFSDRVMGEVIYAIGGGLPADAAKYLALKKDFPLVVIPTALSVDAHFTAASGVRRDGCVYYIDTKAAGDLIIDLDVIAGAPPSIRAAGICDVLSIATGNWDWKFAESQGKNNDATRLVPYISKIADNILDGMLDCAEAAGRGDPAGLKQLADTIALEVQLTYQVGHARPEEGSEHYFAYAVENHVGPGKLHASLVCPGVLIFATLQGQDISRYKKACIDCQIPLNTITEATIRKTMGELPAFCEKHNLHFAIANRITPQMIDSINYSFVFDQDARW